jgi:hypothetical protein
MAAAAGPVVNVTFPPGPVTDEAPLRLLAAESLVANTPFAPWDPVPAAAGAPAAVSLSLFQAIRIFFAPLSISPSVGDITAAKAISMWRIRLTTVAWSRILTALKASGYATSKIPSLRASDQLLATITPVNPTHLHIIAADWAPAELFNIPAGGGAVNAARRAVLQPLSYLNLVNVTMLQRPGKTPMKRVSDLASYLGACSTQASRFDAVGTPAASANALSVVCGAVALSDGLRARNVCRTLDVIQLPVTLRSITLDEIELSSELVDGIAYHRSEMDAKTITETRILNLAPRCASLSVCVLPAFQSLPIVHCPLPSGRTFGSPLATRMSCAHCSLIFITVGALALATYLLGPFHID